MPAYFDSRHIAYRSPFGAVSAGTAVLFRICLPRSLRCTGGHLRLHKDNGETILHDLFWAGMEGTEWEWWDCHFAPAAADLYWYDFTLCTAQGELFLTHLPDGKAALSACEGSCWQLTVYAKDFATPDWLSGGVIYQVFPDRFAASGKPKTGVPADRRIHESWGEQPAWQPDPDGEIRNKDFFGGDLAGITEKIPYLKSLGVTCLYLNPIFESHSNHRYDTADYERIDPLLGDEADFRALCEAAKTAGIRVMLDGVFSHTGADSRYFNREQRYPLQGAVNTPNSPYRSWYHFRHWPDDYESWWGFNTLPEVQETAPTYLDYITGENGIVRRWIKAGAVGGFRLDVADELPDVFLDALYKAVKTEQPDAMVLGEVWEDASNKFAYGKRRRYVLGGQLDSVMNYPFRDAVLRFVTQGDTTQFFDTVLDIVEHYPPQVLRLLMNHIGTHDTERALTVLAGEPVRDRDRAWQAAQSLSVTQRAAGLERLRLATAIQYCLPGVPSIYYGDEAGLEGYKDPFNRGCFPWGNTDEALTDWYRALGKLRKDCSALKEGRFVPIQGENGLLCFAREDAHSALLCAVNASGRAREVWLPPLWRDCTVTLGDAVNRDGVLQLPARSCGILWVDFNRFTQ